MFVVAEEMSNAERATPNSGLLWQCCQILAAEVAIDVLKHAVLGRFNEIRPGVYREFMRVSPRQAVLWTRAAFWQLSRGAEQLRSVACAGCV